MTPTAEDLKGCSFEGQPIAQRIEREEAAARHCEVSTLLSNTIREQSITLRGRHLAGAGLAPDTSRVSQRARRWTPAEIEAENRRRKGIMPENPAWKNVLAVIFRADQWHSSQEIAQVLDISPNEASKQLYLVFKKYGGEALVDREMRQGNYHYKKKVATMTYSDAIDAIATMRAAVRQQKEPKPRRKAIVKDKGPEAGLMQGPGPEPTAGIQKAVFQAVSQALGVQVSGSIDITFRIVLG